MFSRPCHAQLPLHLEICENASISCEQKASVSPADESHALMAERLNMGGSSRKCTGTEVYGIDMEFQDMLHATVRANPAVGTAGARVDASAAEGMRGVEKILPVSNGVGVIANNTWRAFQAAEALEIAWSAPDYPGTSDGIFAALEQALGDPDRYDHRQRDEGDVDAALEAGDVIDARYRIPYLAHAPMEPMNAVVRVLEGQVDRACPAAV